MIVNPKSGRSNARTRLLDALEVFSKYGHTTEVYITQKSMDAKAKAEKTTGYDLVIACGGDGTLNEVTNGLMKLKEKPMIGYFPSGTMNDFASNYNLTNNWKETAERICTGTVKEFDVGLFNNERYFNYVAAFGAFCDVPYATPQNIKANLGNLAYFIEGINRIPGIKPIPVTIKTKDKTKKINAVFGLIFSGNRVSGVEFLDKKKGLMNDGVFNVLIVEYTPNIIEMNDYLSILAKRNSKFYNWFRSDEIELEFEDLDVKWTLDGEKGNHDHKIIIKNYNKALKIIS